VVFVEVAMTGYRDIQRIRRIEKEVNELGFMLANPRNGHYVNEYGDVVALIPKDINSLPIYHREAEIFIGSLEQLDLWLRGVEWARQYDTMLRLSDDKKRKRKEQDELNRQLVKRLKNEELKLRTK
jgi:ABC-type lipopolysaccharide export system ATPase subunit